MELMRRLFTFALMGILFGAAIASVFAPTYLVWYQTPGTGTAMCNCTEVTRETVSSMIRWQSTGSAIGGVLLLTLGIVLTVRARRRAPAAVGSESDRSSSGTPPGSASSTSPPPRTP
jgi:hypothetical protein